MSFTICEAIKLTRGDAASASLLYQVAYWHGNNKEGKPRMSIRIQGKLWIVKSIEDWAKEMNLSYDKIRKSESFKQLLGCKGYNGLILYESLSKIGTDLMMAVGILSLTGIIGLGTYIVFQRFIINIDYKKLNILLTSLVFRVHEEIKEEKVEHACTILQELVIETEKMIFLCKNIHFYLNNMIFVKLL